MKIVLKYWGKDEKKVAHEFGESPIKVKSHMEFLSLKKKIHAKFDVMVSEVHSGIKCGNCKTIDRFEADYIGKSLDNVHCGECGIEVTNDEGRPGVIKVKGMFGSDKFLRVKQADWDSIVFAEDLD